jgi:hypothetical protein
LSDLSKKRETIRKIVLEALKRGEANANNLVASSRKISLSELFEEEEVVNIDGWPITELFDVMQGVTWGGDGCEEIYVIDKTVASSLESKIMYKTIGGRDISACKIDWKETYLIFPYIKVKEKWLPAFRHPSLGGDDALDFSITINSYENGKDIAARLDYRIAKGIINFPNAANHLVKYYSKLEQREFEGKKLSNYNKAWYEYHRPRTPKLICKPKIVCKRMMKYPEFAIDEIGYLPRDSVMAIVPTEKIEKLRKDLERVLKHKFTTMRTLEYALAFLNSEMFQALLERRRSKKRGGYPIVDEQLLHRFIIPRPTAKNSKALEKILHGDCEDVDLQDLCRPPQKSQLMTFS